MSTAFRLNGQGGDLCEACVKIIGRMLPPPHNDQGTLEYIESGDDAAEEPPK